MTAVSHDVRFSRVDGLLWRDTGQHVVVLAQGAKMDVTVLGGGGALLWRMLATPSTFEQLLARLRSELDDGPSEDDVRACIDDLSSQGLLDVGLDR